MFLEIGEAAADGFGVGDGEFLEGGTALIFERADGGDKG